MCSECIFVIIYLLIGFQMGGRTFYWDYKGTRSPITFLVDLFIVPITWPIYIIFMMIPIPFFDIVRDVILRWDK